MVRKVTKIEQVRYEFTRAEILDAMRDVLQEKYPGAALVVDARNMRQQCEFLSCGRVQNVDSLAITTTYEEPDSAPAAPNRGNNPT